MLAVESLVVVSLILLVFAFVFLLLGGNSKPQPILTGRLVAQDAKSFTIEWCRRHAKVSDDLIQTTFEWLPRPDGRTDVWRRSEQVGSC